MNQVTLLLFLVIIVAKISLAFDNKSNHHIGNYSCNATTSSYSTVSACYSTKTYHHTMQYINVTKTHCWKKTITQTTEPTRTIVPTCTRSIIKVPVHTKKKSTPHPHLTTITITSKKNARKSIAKSYSASRSRSKAPSKSKPRSKAVSKSKSRSKAASKSRSKAVSKSRSKAVSKSKSISKYNAKSKSQSRSLSKSRQIYSSKLKASTTATPNIITTTTAVQTTTVPQVAMPTESPAHHDTTAEYNDDDSTTTDQEDEDTATATEQYNYTTTAEEETFTTATPEIIFEPTSSNNDPVFAAPTNNDPNDLYTNIDAAAGNDISNKALGIGLGVGIGCIAALGLAGLLIHNRKRQQQAPLNEEAAATAVPTRWRPQSFMGVVASVVSKLPRSPSQRSKASTDMLAGAAVPGTGVAIGHGEGAVEEQQRRQY